MMTWYVIGYLAVASIGIDPGINEGYAPLKGERFAIAVPSREVCEAIIALNKFANLECWAKPEKSKP